MAFDGTEGGAIDPEVAGSYTAEYRAQNPDQNTACFFGRDILLQLLSQEGCMGIRVYLGVNGEQPELILVGADASEDDQLGEENIVVDLSRPCPPFCSKKNVLNG